MRRSTHVLFSGLVLLFAGGLALADNWPQWRGPRFDGVSKEANVPAEWGPDKNIAWKLPLPGIGSSTPAVWDKHIFLTSADSGDLVLVAVGTDGKKLWQRTLGKGDRQLRGDEGNAASASPSTDGKHVYAFVGSGDVACYDFDGKEKWKFNAQERYGRFSIAFGMHSTPVLHQDRLYLQFIHTNGAHIIAIDKHTGKDVWKVTRESDGTAENKHSYASPTLWQKGDDAYLIAHGNDYATAHRLSDGGEIWRVGDLNPKTTAKRRYRPDLRFVSSPVATPELIIIPSAKNHGVVALFPWATGLVLPGNRFEPCGLPNGTPDVPSPLVHDGLVYLCGEGGRLTCLDAKTGTRHYSQQLHSDRYRGSPVVADGKVYCTARDGTVTVVKTGTKFESVAVNKLPGPLTASLAVSNGRIYARTWDSLYAIGTGR